MGYNLILKYSVIIVSPDELFAAIVAGNVSSEL
jgi:hypothetical protein